MAQLQRQWNDKTGIYQSLVTPMKKHTKAALLSTFIFPGVGHFLLKKHIQGALLAGTALAALYFLIAKSVEKTLLVFEKIQSGEVALDAATITELVSNQTTGTETQLLRLATAALIISWLIGIVDSYRVGRAQEKEIDTGS
jgi:TM2 domain-containing membrane protein YozV